MSPALNLGYPNRHKFADSVSFRHSTPDDRSCQPLREGEIAMMRFALPLCMLTMTGCATQPPPDPPLWTRTDGQKITGNLALEQQIQIDVTVCKGQTQQAASGMQPIYREKGIVGAVEAGLARRQQSDMLDDVAKGCMAQKGYVLLPTSQAEARRLEFAKTAKLRKESAH